MFAGALRSAAKPQLRPRLALWRARPGGMHCSRPASTKPWSGLSPSATSLRVSNPIREIVDQLDLDKINPDKEMIPLSIGDPSRFGNMDTDRSVSSVVIANVHAGMHNGYPPADGFLESRQAVADLYTTEDDPIDANDVMLTSGCSHALQLSIEVLCNPGDVLLVPNPGFPLYKTIADYLGVEVSEYNLLPQSGWEVDLQQLRAQIERAGPKAKALLVNNPSNPCGSVYTKEHLSAILAMAEEYAIPVIADEIYGDMSFAGHTFHRMSELTTEVPILSSGGISKRFLVPGWRLGWIVCYDKHDRLKESGVQDAIKQMCTILVGPNSVMQSALPTILQGASSNLKKFHVGTMETLQLHAEFTTEKLGAVAGLTPVRPQGAMYVMVGIDDTIFGGDDLLFAQTLLEEESVFVLPGQCFGRRGYFRIVTCPPVPVLAEAYERMAGFCQRHRAV